MSGLTVWHSREGGPWEPIDISDRSLIALALGGMEFGETYEDGFGNRYAGGNPDERDGDQ